MNPQLSQQELAAWIDREGLAFEVRMRKSGELRKDTWYQVPGEAHQYPSGIYGYEIRLAPGALNKWNLPHGVEPHNPGGLTPEQITEGGLYRAVVFGDAGEDYSLPKGCEVWVSKDQQWKGSSRVCYFHESITYRVPVNTPFPKEEPLSMTCPVCVGDGLEEIHNGPYFRKCKRCGQTGKVPKPLVKESLTPQPATGQSKTPRTDAAVTGNSDPCSDEYEDLAIFARTLETELTAALAQRDEARRLLGEAGSALKLASSRIEGLRIQTHHESPSRTEAYNWAQETLDAANKITNHLNK